MELLEREHTKIINAYPMMESKRGLRIDPVSLQLVQLETAMKLLLHQKAKPL